MNTPSTRESDDSLAEPPPKSEPEQCSLLPNEPVVAQRPPAPRSRDRIFDTVCHVCAINVDALTTAARGPLNRAVKELRAVNATPESIVAAAQAWVIMWPKATLTPSALAKHYPALTSEQVRRRLERPTERDVTRAAERSRRERLREQRRRQREESNGLPSVEAEGSPG